MQLQNKTRMTDGGMMEEKELVPAGLVTMLLTGYLRTIYIMAAGWVLTTVALLAYIVYCR
nr:MAG TPA: hypothetical protein [Caudoviricetes sp.]